MKSLSVDCHCCCAIQACHCLSGELQKPSSASSAVDVEIGTNVSHEATPDALAAANAQANMSAKPAGRVVGEELDQRASAPTSSPAADATVPTLPNLAASDGAASDGAVGEELDARSSAANGASDVQATAAEVGLLSRGAGEATQPNLHVVNEETDVLHEDSPGPTKDQLEADHRPATRTATVADSEADNTARFVREELDGRANETNPALTMHTADAKSAKAPRYAAVKPSSGESKAKIRPHPNREQQGTSPKHIGALHRSGGDVTNPAASGMSQPHHKGCTSALDYFTYTLPA